MKKFVAWLLVCLMVVSSLPLSAFAADEHDHGAAITEETEDMCPGADEEHNLANSTATKLETVAPVCDLRGHTRYQCNTCGAQFLADFVEATGEDHQWVDVEAKAPTCTENGWTAHKECSKCGQTQGKVEDPATAGAHTPAVKYEGTCGTEAGCTAITYCSSCNVEIGREVVAGSIAGHTWLKTPVIDKDPVCGVKGEATYKCQYCDATKKVVIDPVEHNMTEYKAKDPTCTEPGNKQYFVCSICEGYYVLDGGEYVVTTADDVVIDELNHDWQYNVIENPLNPGTDIKDWYCANNCGEDKADEPSDHVFGTVQTEAAKCGVDGKTYHVCKSCGYSEDISVLEALEHDWVENRVITPAQCGTAGETEYKCSHCGETETRETDATDDGHVYSVVVETYQDLTCTQDGKYLMKCANCTSTKEVTKTHEGHKAQDVILTPAKCSATGLKNIVCSECDTVLEENIVLDKLPHTYNTEDGGTTNNLSEAAWIEFAPTCTSVGYKYRLCIVCNLQQDYIQTADSTGHDDYQKGTNQTYQAPGCESDGLATWTCSCGEKLSKVLDRTGHSTDKVIVVAPVCNKYGYEIHYCTNDNCNLTAYTRMNVEGVNYDTVDEDGKALKVIELVINKDGGYDEDNHNFIEQSVNEATCSAIGNIFYLCEHCGVEKWDVLEKIPHTAGTQVDANASTCTDDGNYAYTICSVCNKKYVEVDGVQTEKTDAEVVDPADGHAIEAKDAQPATCYQDGTIAHYACTVCKKTFSDAEGKVEINALADSNRPAHAWGELIEEVPATCTEDGTKAHYECENEGCDAFSFDGTTEAVDGTLTIDAGHDYGTLIDATDATCTENATIAHYVCSRCTLIFNEKFEQITTFVTADSALGHDLIEAGETAATCISDGCKKHYACQRTDCGKYFSDAEGTTEVTYDDIAIKFVIEETPKYNSIEAAKEYGHGNLTFVSGPVPATCTRDQYNLYACDDCKRQLIIVEAGTALGHLYPNGLTDDGTGANAPDDLKATSCGGNYIKAYDCARCNQTVKELYLDNNATHTPGESQAVAKTCTTDGWNEYFYCTECNAACDKDGKTLSAEEVEALRIPASHGTLTHVTEVKKTCTTDGNSEHWICPDCGKYYSDAACTTETTAEAVKDLHIGHVLVDHAYQAPTCSTLGTAAHKTCENCDLIFDANGDEYEGSLTVGELDPNNHEDMDYWEAVEPNCREGGWLEYYECSGCGKIYADEEGTEYLGEYWTDAWYEYNIHTPDLNNNLGYDATCTENGMMDYYMCSICFSKWNQVYVDAEGNRIYDLSTLVITAEHKALVDVDAVPNSCTQPGHTAGQRCSECGLDTTTALPQLDHNSIVVDEALTADCGGFTYKHYDCPTCELTVDENGNRLEYITDFVRLPGHNIVDSTDVADGYVAPTCQATGTGVKVCDCNNPGCTYVPETYEIEQLKHKNADKEEFTDACTDTTENRNCVICGQEIGNSHNVKTTTVAATCTEFGYTLTYCADCGKQINIVYTETKGDHTYVTNYNPVADYLNPGTKVITCQFCDYHATESYTVTGVQYILSYENANGGSVVADSSLIKVTVSAQSYVGIKACMLKLDMSYDSSVVTFEKAEKATGSAFTMNGAQANVNESDNSTYVSVMVTALDGSAPTDVAIGNEPVAIVDLYFRVDNAVATETAFDLIYMETTARDTTVSQADCKSMTVAISAFMDANGDGVIDNADVLATYDAYQAETYNALVDIDKDGVITASDIAYMYEHLLGKKDYNDMTDLGLTA